MNLLNMIWGFVAFAMGLVFVAVGNPLFQIFIDLYSTMPSTQIILWLGLILYDVVMLFVFPLAITMSDDNFIKRTVLGGG